MPVPLLFPRMLKGRKFDYAYDVRGNQRYRYLSADRSKFWEYTWDGENRLRQAALTLGGQVVRTLSFKYDPFGRRIEKQVSDTASTVTTTYVYDGENIVFTTVNDGTNTTTSHTIHGPGIDEPLAQITNGTSTYYHADGLGSIVALTDAAGQIVQRITYDAFGLPTATDPSFANSYAFTAREWDKELGLYYYRARYYDPMEGRFVSKDPIGFAGGINVYAYVENNPVNLVDPDGRFAILPVLAIIGTVYGVLEGVDYVTSVYYNSIILKHLQEQEKLLKVHLEKTDCKDIQKINLLNEAIKANALQQTRIGLGLGKDTISIFYGKATDRR
ncbi:RHS repeat-associated core domain-containing protein [Trichloromonas acetexigens]|uniref:RHS repeat-associated core domain-containing protein n=1 Tax=Trichloromonas acetexigens TaxID=38815 RepID=UPI001F0D469C|nr:RHS repeat-associated core domain-containing protein [Desulfuromonas acetexigens]